MSRFFLLILLAGMLSLALRMDVIEGMAETVEMQESAADMGPVADVLVYQSSSRGLCFGRDTTPSLAAPSQIRRRISGVRSDT